MASTTHHHRRASILLAILLTAMASPMPIHTTAAAAAATGGCEGDKFTTSRTYTHCAALPTLGARLHWTHDPKTGSLSVAFVAKPPAPTGWVSWAINPTGDGMKGAQALVAFRTTPSSPYTVNTYNVTRYAPLGAKSTPIAFKATELAADEVAGEVRMYGKLQLPAGTTEVVSHIWQVGSAVNGGAPVKHAFDKENLEAKGKLALSGAALAPAPAPDASGSSPPAMGGSAGAGPSAGKPSAAARAASAFAPVVMVVALVAGFLAIV